MSLRAVILGLLLGLTVSVTTYFNDFVIRQTMLVGNLLPLSVFGGAMVLLFLVNPALRPGGERAPLRASEMAVIVAIALAACGFPGSGFFRGFTTIASLPGHWNKTQTSWRATGALSYVPGGSPMIAPGQVTDWRALGEALRQGRAAAEAGEDSDQGAAIVASRLSPETIITLNAMLDAPRIEPDATNRLLLALNRELIEPAGAPGEPPALFAALSDAGLLNDTAQGWIGIRETLDTRIKTLAGELERVEADRGSVEAERRSVAGEEDSPEAVALDRRIEAFDRRIDALEMELGYDRGEATELVRRANRSGLVGVFEGAIAPMPGGGGVLVAGGRPDPYVIDSLLEGRSAKDAIAIWDLPWYAWWPPIRLWWGMMLLLAVCMLCLALVLHPQWSTRELLPYPIPRFVDEVSQRQQGAWLPDVARSKLFWIAVLSLVVLHTVNGLSAWFPTLPKIPLWFDFNPLRQLFPDASRVWGSNAYFSPRLFLTVVAFTFFLTTPVSFSLGISQAVYMLFGSFLLKQGIPLEFDYAGSKKTNMMRFGAYLGVAAMIAYTGRRYFLNVFASAFGLPRHAETPAYATWASRVLVLAFIGAVALLTTSGLSAWMSILFVLLVLLIAVVISRIVCETGLFFIQASWVPVGIVTGLFGFEAIGPTTYILLAIASMMLIVDPRELLMPFLANGLKMGQTTGKASPGKLAPWLGVMIVTGFLAAGGATLSWQYYKGVNGVDGWTKKALPSMPFDRLSTSLSESAAEGSLTASVQAGGFDASAIDLDPTLYSWMGLGVVLVLATAIARLRLPWWPLHPVLFVVWCTYPITQFAFSFLIGWAIKAAVMRGGGARGYQALRPLMVGIIAGELFMGILWIGVGAMYYWITGLAPTSYRIFPS